MAASPRMGPDARGLTTVADRRALIVASDRYQHEGLGRLGSPAHDAEALQSVLANPYIGRFDVRVVQNQPSHVIRREIADFFAERQPDDMLLLHFSCHGLKNAAGELYLASTDTLPTRLAATAVAAQSISQEMLECRARRIVVLLDCCYGGAFPRGLVVRAGGGINVEDSFPIAGPDSQRTDDPRGRVVITASSATEYAFEEDRLLDTGQRTPSVFTSALVQGLTTGQADAGLDGLVDLDELYGYVHARVAAITNGRQNPVRWGTTQGKLVIAWAPPAARIAPVAIPDELADRAQDAQQGARLAAVKDLRRIALDEDIAQAAGALARLRELTIDDSNQVSAAATATLAEAQLRVMPAEVDAGDIKPGDPPVSHTIRLAGSPLARVFQATSTTRWLRVEQSDPHGAPDAWIRATIEPAALAEYHGELSGEISVVNRIGELRIPVNLRIPVKIRPPWLTSRWLRDTRVLALAGAGVVLSASITASEMIRYSNLLGVGFLLLRAVVLAASIVLIGGSGLRRVAGQGLAAATIVYFLTDAIGTLHNDAAATTWLEFLAVITFSGLLVIRLWPFPDIVHGRPVLVSPAQRPHAWVVIAAAAVQLLLLFVAIPHEYLYVSSFTVTDVVGVPGALLAVAPIAGLCVVAVLADEVTTAQRIFVTTTLVAYVGPELYFMLGSLLLGRNFVYYGDNIFDHETASAVWFVVVQAAAAIALTAATLLFLKKGRAAVR